MNAKNLTCALLCAAAGLGPAAGQSWDTSGNGLLNGTYYFREVAWQGQYDATNDLNFATSVYGTISFDGNGHYTISGAQEFDSNNGTAVSYSVTGTYSLAASGYGFLTGLLVSGDTLNVLVSNGILVGSSTDNANGYNDLMIAAPLTSQALSTFQGNYSVVGVDSPTLGVASTRAYSFQLSADGNGGVGTVRASGYFAGNGTNVSNQSFSGIRYRFSNGAEVIQFGGELTQSNVNTNLLGGTKYLYFSPDGNFFFGGSPTGWDMILGVRQSATTTFSGLYYAAGLTQDDSPASQGYVNLNSGYGSLNVLPNSSVLAHQRVLLVPPTGGAPYDYTYSDLLSQSGSTFSDSFTQYSVGTNGAFAIGFAKSPGLGVEVLLQTPPASGQGVYVYPTGVVNAGSLAPFTASWAPGELVSIFGTNLAGKTSTDGSLPTTLAGVQVLVNGTPAPIYFVSPGQINAVIPVSVTSLTASLQVVNNGTPSNTVFNYVTLTQPGVFNSYTALPAIQHSDYTMVTSSSPVRPGETILVYLTGLGTLDGSGNSTEKFTASMGGTAATVLFAGSQSTVGGGYQMNVTVPSNVTTGNVYLDISGPDSYNSEVVIPVSASSTGAVQSSAQAVHRVPVSRSVSKSTRRPSLASPVGK